MGPLDDSVERAYADLHTKGSAVVRRLLPSVYFREVEELIMDALVRNGLSDGTLSEDGQPLHTWDGTTELIEPLALVEINRSEYLEHLCQAEPVVDLVTHLLDLDSPQGLFVHPTKVVRSLPPAESPMHFPAGVHQDYPELQGSRRQLTLWIPIFPVTRETGGLPVYSATHRHVLPLVLADNPSGWQVDPRQLGAPSYPSLDRGDVLVFTTFTPHGGSVNSGTGWRYSVEGRFQPLSDPIAASNMTPRSSTSKSWDEHYRGWQKFAYYWIERQPPSVPFDRTWERWRDVMSIQEGFSGNTDAFVALTIASEFSTEPEIKRTARSILRDWEKPE